MIRQAFAIAKKDFAIDLSYKTAFLSNAVGVILNLIIFYFIDRLFGERATPHLEEYGVNYFSYVLLSLALFSYIGVGVGSFAEKLRQEQLQGTLESLVLSPASVVSLLCGMCAGNLLFATVNVIVYFLFGHFVFGINFTQINVFSAAVILLLTVTSFAGLGIISASFILVLKRGNPVGWVLNMLEGILGGVYFPVTVMPAFLQLAALCLPITYAVKAFQLAVYQGYNVIQLKSELLVLLIFSLILTPLSVFIFQKSLDHVRRSGTLGQY